MPYGLSRMLGIVVVTKMLLYKCIFNSKVDTYLLELDVAQVKLLGHPIGAERW